MSVYLLPEQNELRCLVDFLPRPIGNFGRRGPTKEVAAFIEKETL
jgi:hypothetical protein